MVTPLPDLDNPAELRKCLRDLVGLLGLPALWSSREPEGTLRLLAETLIEVLSLDVCYVSAALRPEAKPCHSLYVNGKVAEEAQVNEWLPLIHPCVPNSKELRVTQEATPIGVLQIVSFSLSYYGQEGQIIAGSLRNNFPKPTELVLLRSAASLAASGLRTARLTLEREKALQAKDEFLAMLGHELRNPLAPIVAALNLMKIKANGAISLEQSIIERQVTHLTALVDDLLDITRITSGKITLNLQPIELGAVVATAIEAAQPLIEQRRHQLICDVPDSGLLVEADATRLSQVISNLLINAAKYTEPGGRISLFAVQDASHVSLKVQDNGIGIDGNLLPHVFDLFQQGQVSLDRSRGGLGIGLTVVKTLVSMHGGTVGAESQGIGSGSTFTVTLPITSEKGNEPATAEQMPEKTSVKKEVILVVDDNKDAADVMGDVLNILGHEVHVRYAPGDALSLCETIQPTVAILDIGLPVISGYELASHLRSRFSQAPPRIIAVTGYGQPQDHQRSAEAGIDIHLVKPVNMETLLGHLQNPVNG